MKEEKVKEAARIMEAEIKEAEAEARSWRVEMRVQDPSAWWT